MGVIEFGGVELEAAHHVNGFFAATELKQALRIGVVLRTHPFKSREEIPEEEPKPAVAPEGALREASIDQEIRDSTALETPQKIGPDLGLHQNDHFGVDEADGALDVFPAIDGVVDLGNMRWKVVAQEAHARRSCRGDNDLVQGQQRFHGPDQLRAHVHLADAHRMEPDYLTVRQGLLELGVIQAEALAEPGLPGPATVHLKEIPRSRQGEPDVEENVVEKSHEQRCRGKRNGTEVTVPTFRRSQRLRIFLTRPNLARCGRRGLGGGLSRADPLHKGPDPLAGPLFLGFGYFKNFLGRDDLSFSA